MYRCWRVGYLVNGGEIMAKCPKCSADLDVNGFTDQEIFCPHCWEPLHVAKKSDPSTAPKWSREIVRPRPEAAETQQPADTLPWTMDPEVIPEIVPEAPRPRPKRQKPANAFVGVIGWLVGAVVGIGLGLLVLAFLRGDRQQEVQADPVPAPIVQQPAPERETLHIVRHDPEDRGTTVADFNRVAEEHNRRIREEQNQRKQKKAMDSFMGLGAMASGEPEPIPRGNGNGLGINPPKEFPAGPPISIPEDEPQPPPPPVQFKFWMPEGVGKNWKETLNERRREAERILPANIVINYGKKQLGPVYARNMNGYPWTAIVLPPDFPPAWKIVTPTLRHTGIIEIDRDSGSWREFGDKKWNPPTRP